MMIIKLEASESGQHIFQSQSHRLECWIDGYIEVPKELEDDVMRCNGYCDLTIENDALINVVPHPELKPEPEQVTTVDDILNTLLGVNDNE